MLDYESFLFWDELFSLFDPITIRKQLFSTDIIDDIYNVSFDKKFDNIFLSNLGQHYSINELEKLLNKLSFNLNDNGKMFGSYLYKTTKDTEYREEWA